ncbi:acyl-CoA thioesterase [Actinomadura formosensis]|uniref:acyl-CoA thioesterase n=1 Tax=Actinomadura formosensis TaxID=60706 RepID=UPI003D8F9D4E
MTGDRATWRTEFQLRFRDFDYLGHMTATSYLAFFEEARVAWLAEGTGDPRPAYVVAAQHLEFEREVLPADGPVTVVIEPAGSGAHRVEVREEMRGADGALRARSTATLVMWDRAARRPRCVSAAERRLFGG